MIVAVTQSGLRGHWSIDYSLDAREREYNGPIDRLLAEQVLYRCRAVLRVQIISDVRSGSRISV